MLRNVILRIVCLMVLGGLDATAHPLVASRTTPAKPTPNRVDYNRDVRPIFSENCYACHGPDGSKRKAGLRLDRKEEAFQKLESGKIAIVPSNLSASELISRITTSDDDDRMPPLKTGKHLAPSQIETLKKWVAQGAVWTPHWSYVSPQRPSLPMVKNKSWIRTPVDNFILARLESEELKPSAEADKIRLLRRVTLDLTGLPPTPQEVNDFLADKSKNAFSRVVDRLMASPHYGERMAQFWLDVARYADTNGYHIDNHRDLWLWRDWVINAFNQDMPFDQFTIEQLAGDVLPNPTTAQKIASGFNRNEMVNFEGGADPNEYAVKYIVGRVDCTSRTFLGTTMACCECHDHKYDPVTQKDYYRFFAFFNTISEKGLDGNTESPEPRLQVPRPGDDERRKEWDKKIAELGKQEKALLESTNQSWNLSQLVWETMHRSALTNFEGIDPVSITSTGPTTFKKLPDGSYLAEGTATNSETYEIVLSTHSPNVTGVRLETFPDESLPGGQAGRATNGDFVLTAFEAEARLINPGEPESPLFGPWYSLGPFKGKDAREAFSQSFIAEREIDLQAAHGTNNLRWVRQTNWSDGVVQTLKGENNVATYLFRTVTVSKPQDIYVSLGSDDGITAWINGRKVLARDIARPAAPDQEFSRLHLDAGTNELLLKINNVEGGYGYYFKSTGTNKNSYTVEFTSAVADFSRKDFPIGAVIEGKTNSGWSAGSEGTNARPHQAIFIAQQPFGNSNGAEIKIRLKFGARDQASLGRFRLGLTSSLGLTDFAGLPEKVRSNLFVEADQRSASQKKELQKYYRENFESEVKEHIALVAREKEERTKFEKSIPLTMVMKEMEKPRETFLLVRGDWQTKGEKVTPGVPSIFPPLPEGTTNRLALAKWLVSTNHPLTARVTVNRFWQQFFGNGIVKTADDFGSQGEWPSHPELLDWLAREFIDSGWNIKHLQKLIVLSATYRQDSRVDAPALEKDPDNRLLARGPRIRLEAETVRDQALAVSGLLNSKIGGPSVFPYQPPGLWEAIGFTDNGNFSSQKYVQSKGEDNFRRGLYTYWKRSMPYASFVAFDAPSREVCTVRRPRTNTPLQALTLLNDPVYVEAARAFAERLLREAGRHPDDRLRYAFRLCLGRSPSTQELQILGKALEQQLAEFRNDPAAAKKLVQTGESKPDASFDPAEVAAWTAIGNILFNLDEMITKG